MPHLFHFEALALEREDDVTVESAFTLCCVRTRKGGLKSLSLVDRMICESFKVLLWSQNHRVFHFP